MSQCFSCCCACLTNHCATEIHESHSVTLEWQVEKVINVLTQWWQHFWLSNAIRRKRKMTPLSSGKGWIMPPGLCLWWSDKDQPSVSEAQGKRGRTKSMLDGGELKSSVAHTSSTCLKRNRFVWKGKNPRSKNKILIFAIALFCDQTIVTQGVDHIFRLLSIFLVKTWSEASDHRERPRVPGYIWSGSVSIDRDTSLGGAAF